MTRPPSDPIAAVDDASHRALAVALFNAAWTLLDKPDRTADDDAEMVGRAYASRWHWGVVGTPLNHARGEWQIARCCAEAGLAASAMHHATRCLEACRCGDFGAFDLAFAHESMARALQADGQLDAVHTHVAASREIGAAIEAQDDRGWLEQNLAAIESRMA